MSILIDVLLVVVIGFSLRKIKMSIIEKSLVIAIIVSLSITVIHFVFLPYMTSYNTTLISISLLVVLALVVYMIINKEDFGSFRIKLEENISTGMMAGFVFIVPFIITVRVLPVFPFYIQIILFIIIYGLLVFYRSKVNNKDIHIVIILIVGSVLMVLINQYDFFEGGYSSSQNLPYLNDTVIGDTYRRVERFSAPYEGGFNIYFKDALYEDDVIYVVTDNNNVYMRKDDKTTIIYTGSSEYNTVIDNSLYSYGEYVYIIMNYDLIAYHKEDETIYDVDITYDLEYMVLYEEDGTLYYERNSNVFEVDGVNLTLTNKDPLHNEGYVPFMYNQFVLYYKDYDSFVFENETYKEIEYPYDSITTYVSDKNMMFDDRNHVFYTHIDGGYMYIDSNSDLEHVYDGGIVVKTLIDGDFFIERYVEVDNALSGNIFINNNVYLIIGTYLLLLVPIRRRK